jgi:hypothetical protein
MLPTITVALKPTFYRISLLCGDISERYYSHLLIHGLNHISITQIESISYIDITYKEEYIFVETLIVESVKEDEYDAQNAARNLILRTKSGSRAPKCEPL